MMLPFLVVGLIVGIYIASYVLNRRMEAPLEKHEMASEETCASCTNYSCGIKQNMAEER